MRIKIFADGAVKSEMLKLYKEKAVDGFTTNPTLMAKAGITDYLAFAKDILNEIKDLPISFEVFSDDFDDMYRQALILAKLGDNVNVKIPIMNTKGEPSYNLINRLDKEVVKLNITAVFTLEQVNGILDNVSKDSSHIISIFAGRIADTGINPFNIMLPALNKIRSHSDKLELLWASPREVYNVYEADKMGCDIITIVPSIVEKLNLGGKNLTSYSRETVEMFYNDAVKSGFKL